MFIGSQQTYQKVDIWAAGIACYELLVGKTPFLSESIDETKVRILNEKIQFPDFVSIGARDLISKMLTKNPDQRISPDDVINHPWIIANTS